MSPQPIVLYRNLVRAARQFPTFRDRLAFNIREAFLLYRGEQKKEVVERLIADGNHQLGTLRYLSSLPKESRDVLFRQ
jgi:hypothetical protein